MTTEKVRTARNGGQYIRRWHRLLASAKGTSVCVGQALNYDGVIEEVRSEELLEEQKANVI